MGGSNERGEANIGYRGVNRNGRVLWRQTLQRRGMDIPQGEGPAEEWEESGGY